MGESTEAPPDVRYKIGEVCRLADVQPYVLRYWESEFPVLAADRSLPGPRSYSDRDLMVVKRVKQLLYDEGYTIAGAKKRLESELREGTLPAASSEAPAGPLAAEPPPLPPAAVSVRPRRGRVAVMPSEEPLMFEDAALPAPEPAARAVAPTERNEKRDTRDVRIVRVVAELKEIRSLLSREPA